MRRGPGSESGISAKFSEGRDAASFRSGAEWQAGAGGAPCRELGGELRLGHVVRAPSHHHGLRHWPAHTSSSPGPNTSTYTTHPIHLIPYISAHWLTPQPIMAYASANTLHLSPFTVLT